jgi:2,3-diketo-5-methylthio-1-phosphopentane phosphatase
MSNKNYLLIFDFDKTIINNDLEHEITKEFLPEIYKEKNGNLYTVKNWIPFNNYLYNQMKQKNKTIIDIKNKIKSLELSPNFNELFNFIKDNKKNFECMIFSASNKYAIKCVLKDKKIFDLFSLIVGNEAEENNENLIVVKSIGYLNCNDCNPALCKTLVFNEYFKENEKKKYDKIIFICDGYNDYCLSKNLSENDVVFVRKNFGLDNILNDEEKKKKIKCNIKFWENGFDIINVLKDLI